MTRLFRPTGAHVLVDGQFGSTGKGALASWLARKAAEEKMLFDGAISSGGPNSGHTSYFNGEKIVLKHLPTFAVHMHLMGQVVPVYLSAGAIIDPEVLRREAKQFEGLPIFVHPNAAIVTERDRDYEQSGSIAAIASTQTGTGAALARKILREPNVIAKYNLPKDMGSNVAIMNHNIRPDTMSYFVEVSQGFSLGINSEFYPHVTSRECTVMQALADARIAPRFLSRTYMCIRTFPIRVGDLHGNTSGGWYEDQHEMAWEEIGVPLEYTTVTKRVRRVASFSERQLVEAIRANDPDFIGVNFLNYLHNDRVSPYLNDLIDIAESTSSKKIDWIAGFGPEVSDWSIINET